jgi:hypothetical protein
MSGWKQWQLAEVVEFEEFQSYLQNQVVQVYADSAARGSALGTAVIEGMVSYLEDTNAVQVYTGAGWEAVAVGDITSVTAGTALTGGGTAGDVTLNVNLAAISIGTAQVTGLADALAAKENTITLTANRAVASDGSGKLAASSVTATELGYLSGVTSAIQTQINGRVSQTNGVVTTAAVGSVVVRNIAISTATPSGGIDGDVWLQYTP